jgi:hypothetical protein
MPTWPSPNDHRLGTPNTPAIRYTRAAHFVASTEVGSALAAREKLDPEESLRSQPKVPMTAARAGRECERPDLPVADLAL